MKEDQLGDMSAKKKMVDILKGPLLKKSSVIVALRKRGLFMIF